MVLASPRRTGMRVAGALMGAAAGLVGGLMIGPIASHGECPSPTWMWVSPTAAGATVGGLLMGR